MNKQEIQSKLQQLENQMAELRKKLDEPEKFEWKSEKHNTHWITPTFVDSNVIAGNKPDLSHGRYRKTKVNVEKALARNKRANRLEALAEQIDVDYHGEYYISLFLETMEWITIPTSGIYFYPEAILMKYEVAEKICEMLNNGQFDLDGDE